MAKTRLKLVVSWWSPAFACTAFEPSQEAPALVFPDLRPETGISCWSSATHGPSQSSLDCIGLHGLLRIKLLSLPPSLPPSPPSPSPPPSLLPPPPPFFFLSVSLAPYLSFSFPPSLPLSQFSSLLSLLLHPSLPPSLPPFFYRSLCFSIVLTLSPSPSPSDCFSLPSSRSERN